MKTLAFLHLLRQVKNFGSFPSSHLPGENFGFVKMAFTCMKRAQFLGLEIIGRQHPLYQKKQVIIDNGCFPEGSHAAYVRLKTVDCEDMRKTMVGSSKKDSFNKFMDGIVQNQGKYDLMPKTIGLCDPSKDKDAYRILTQAEKLRKQESAKGSLPPEMESDDWQDYKRLNPDSVGEPYEPFMERWFVSPALYALAHPSLLGGRPTQWASQNMPRHFVLICTCSVGSTTPASYCSSLSSAMQLLAGLFFCRT